MSDKVIKQYKELKAKHKGVFIFCKTDDCYEAYNEDADMLCSITDAPCDDYGNGKAATINESQLGDLLRKLIAKGKRVAIIEDEA